MQQTTQEWVKNYLRLFLYGNLCMNGFLYIVHMEISSVCAQFNYSQKNVYISIQMVTNNLHKFVLVS